MKLVSPDWKMNIEIEWKNKTERKIRKCKKKFKINKKNKTVGDRKRILKNKLKPSCQNLILSA